MKKNDLGNDNVIKLVIGLALPTMLAQFVNVLYSIVDRMFIGNIPEVGGLALAGVGICSPIITLLSSFGTLVGIGGSIFMATKMGEGDNDKAKNILSNSFTMLFVISIVLTILFLVTKNQLINSFGASENTFEYANKYLTIYTAGTFFALMAIGLNYFITCQGFAIEGMLTVIIGAITNILLDAFFIVVLKMGVSGAALATVIAQFCSCTFAFIFLISKKIHIKLRLQRMDFSIVKTIIKIGISPFIIIATDSIIIIVMNTVLQKYGGESQGDLLISSVTIVQSYFLLITGPLLGITSGTQAILSYNFGAKKIDRVKLAEKYITIMSVIFTVIMFILSWLVPQYFVRLFTNQDDYINMSIYGIRVFTIGIIPMAFQYSFVDGLTALGQVKIALSLSITRKSLYLLSTCILPIFLMAKYTFFAQPIADIISATVSTITFFIFIKNIDQRVSLGA